MNKADKQKSIAQVIKNVYGTVDAHYSFYKSTDLIITFRKFKI